MLNLLITDAAAQAPHFPLLSTLLLLVGFIIAVTVGSIAWYNSKRPPGWEDKKRPDVVPKVDKSEHPGLGNPEAQ